MTEPEASQVNGALDEALLENLRGILETQVRALAIQDALPEHVRALLPTHVENWDAHIPELLTAPPAKLRESVGMLSVLLERFEDWLSHVGNRVLPVATAEQRPSDIRDLEDEVDELEAKVSRLEGMVRELIGLLEAPSATPPRDQPPAPVAG